MWEHWHDTGFVGCTSLWSCFKVCFTLIFIKVVQLIIRVSVKNIMVRIITPFHYYFINNNQNGLFSLCPSVHLVWKALFLIKMFDKNFPSSLHMLWPDVSPPLTFCSTDSPCSTQQVSTLSLLWLYHLFILESTLPPAPNILFTQRL